MSDEIKVKGNSGKMKLVIAILAVIVVALTVGTILLLPKSATAKKVAKQLFLGEKYLSELEYEQAIAAYELAIEIDPKCTDAYLGLAEVYTAMGEYDKAEEILDTAWEKVEKKQELERIADKKTEVGALKESTPQKKPGDNADGTEDTAPSPKPTATPPAMQKPTKTPTPETTQVEGAIDWEDAALEQAMRELTGIYDRVITEKDVSELTELDLSSKGIVNITALRYLPKLTVLYLSDNAITDVTPLFGLVNLTVLYLSDNQIRDISALAGLTNLKKLYLDGNEIDDISPIAGLNKLEIIVLTGNGITDYSILYAIASLTSITVDGVSITPTPKPTATPTPTMTPTPKPTATPTPKPTATPTLTPEPTKSVGSRVTITGRTVELENAEVGDYVTFGTYEQDNDLTNGAEAIEWLVLDKQDGKVLLLSKYALDAKPYNETDTDVTWETCSLRSWLNSEFYRTAFSEKERGSIAETLVRNADNPENGTEGGNDTRDKVFLLSIEEVTTYFDSNPNAKDPARRAKVTEYAKAQGGEAYSEAEYGWYGKTEYDGNGSWWLRSPGYYGHSAARVYLGGYVYRYGNSVDFLDFVVRPALWIAP